MKPFIFANDNDANGEHWQITLKLFAKDVVISRIMAIILELLKRSV